MHSCDWQSGGASGCGDGFFSVDGEPNHKDGQLVTHSNRKKGLIPCGKPR